MKTLLLLRHGKSDWGADFDHDHERPLAKRGRRAAQAMGRYLAGTSQLPDHVLCSTAVRARETLERARTAGGWDDGAVSFIDALYLPDQATILREVRRAPASADTLLLVGHEPSFSTLAGRLIGGANVRVPTAALVRIALDIEAWEDVGEGCGQLILLLPPKQLGT